MRVLVFGASSYIGTYLTPTLQKQGFKVRASARHRRVLRARGWQNIEIVRADAFKTNTLDAALQDIDVAIYLVHSMAAGKHFDKLDNIAARNFSIAAHKAGVKKIIYLGSLLPQNPTSKHFISRQQTGDNLRFTSVPVIEIRAGIVIGPGSAAFEVMRDLVNHLPILFTPKWVFSKTKPIALDDLLQYITHLININTKTDKIYEVGGPEILSYEQMMNAYATFTQRKFKLIKMPLLTPKVVSYWLRVVTSVSSNIAKSLIEGLTHDLIAKDDDIKQLIPLQLKTFDKALIESFKVEKNNDKVAHWVDGSIACRDYDPSYSYYAKSTSAMASSTATIESIFAQVTAFGGEHGYYYAEVLWYLRRLLDWFGGGPSFRRKRRHPVDVRVGDVVDSWRVIAVEPSNILTLKMEMKGPGSGVLEFIIRDKGEHRTVSATAYWHPAGPAGLLYWYACLPAHLFLFKGLTKQIANRAEKSEKINETLKG